MTRITHILAACALSGCTIVGPGSSGHVDDLERARQVWAELAWADYDMAMERQCYCAGFGLSTVYVRADSTAAVVPEDAEFGFGPSERQWYPTVDDLFDIVDEAHREAASLEVTYSDDGWPERVSIDWIAEAVDDEIVYVIHEVSAAASRPVVRVGFESEVDVFGRTVRFSDIAEESRCAVGAECIWAGRVILDFAVTDPPGDPVAVQLILGETRNGENTTATAAGLELGLVAVEPYPDLRMGPTIPSQYVAWVVVSEQP